MADQFRNREIDPLRAWNEGVLPRMQRPLPQPRDVTAQARKVKPFVAPAELPPLGSAVGDTSEAAASQRAQDAIDERKDPTAGQAIAGAVGQTLLGSAWDKINDELSARRDPSFGDPDTSFKAPVQALDGLNEDEQAWLQGSINESQFKYRQKQIEERQEELRALFHKGMASGLVLSIGASVPESLIGGGMIAAARSVRAGMTGARVAAQSRSAFRVAADAALSNAAETSIQAAYDPFTGAQDVLMATALGGVLGLPGGIASVRRLDGKQASMEELDADLKPNDKALEPESVQPDTSVADAATETVRQWDAEDAAKAKEPDQPAATESAPARPADIGEDPAAWHPAPKSAFPKDALDSPRAIEAEDIEPVARKPEDAPAVKTDEPAPRKVNEGVDASGRKVRSEDIEITPRPKVETTTATNELGDTVEVPRPAPEDVDVAPQPVAEVKPGDRSEAAFKKAAGLNDIDYVAGAKSGYSLRNWAKTIGIDENDVVVTRSVYHSKGVPNEAIAIAREIVDEFIPGHQVAIIGRKMDDGTPGRSTFLHPKKTGIEIDFDNPHWRFNLAHELGHRVFGNAIASQHVPSQFRGEFLQFRDNLQKAMSAKSTDDIAKDALAARFDATDPRLRLSANVLKEDASDSMSVLDVMAAVVDGAGGDDAKKYLSSLHEIGADQFVKFYNRSGRIESGWPKMTKKVGAFLSDIYNRMVRYWKKIAGHAGDATEANPRNLFRAMQEKARQRKANFIDDRESVTPTKDLGIPRLGKLVDRGVSSREAERVLEPAAELRTADIRIAPQKGSTPESYGIRKTAASEEERFVHAAAKWFHAKASTDAPDRVAFGGWQDKMKGNPESVANSLISASALMANSGNVIIRWFGARMAESPSGTAGPRRVTGAVKKYRMEQELAGTDLRNLDAAKDAWLKEQGVALHRRVLSVADQRRFGRALTDALNAARKGKEPDSPAMRAAVSAMQAMNTRIEKIETSMLGKRPGRAERGFMEQRISGKELSLLNAKQHDALTRLIANKLAGQNGITGAQARAIAESHLRSAAANRMMSSASSPSLTKIDGQALMDVLGAPGGRFDFDFRIDLDASIGDGKTVADILNHDHYGVMRNRASATAGWAALSEIGVKDAESANLLRSAILVGKGDEAAAPHELRAFDQVVAELTGGAFGTAGQSVALSSATTLTAVVRLGGLIFNTAGEILNVAAHIGFSRSLRFIPEFRRLRRELLAIRDGKPIENGLLSSMEKRYGAAFGADHYLMVSPWDQPGLRADSVDNNLSQGALLRALNGAGHAQHVLTGVRAMQATQTRYAAQEVTRLALERAKHSNNNPKLQKVLEDIGLSREWLEKNRAALDAATTWKGGQAVGFDIEKLPADAADEFNTAIWRASKQMIQGTFAGESGAWIHSDVARVMLQMKTFAINSIEKQQIRFWHNHGALNFAMTFLATASAALPIHLARVAWNAQGRSEQERREYIDRALEPSSLFTATMTYMGLSGVLPDAIQAITTLAGVDSYNQSLIGGSFLPAADMLNDIYSSATTPSKATRVVPLLNAAPVIPFMNMIRAPLKEQEKAAREEAREAKN